MLASWARVGAPAAGVAGCPTVVELVQTVTVGVSEGIDGRPCRDVLVGGVAVGPLAFEQGRRLDDDRPAEILLPKMHFDSCRVLPEPIVAGGGPRRQGQMSLTRSARDPVTAIQPSLGIRVLGPCREDGRACHPVG